MPAHADTSDTKRQRSTKVTVGRILCGKPTMQSRQTLHRFGGIPFRAYNLPVKSKSATFDLPLLYLNINIAKQ